MHTFIYYDFIIIVEKRIKSFRIIINRNKLNILKMENSTNKKKFSSAFYSFE